MKTSNDASYRKWNDQTLNSSKYHKKDGTNVRAKLKEELKKQVKWLACGLCHGSGKQKDYEDEWDCPVCEGQGGSFV